MIRPEEIAVVIPCLNEGRTIGLLVREVRRLLPHVLVVNDGSNDSTARDAVQAGAIVVNHLSPQGKGACLRAGFAAALENGYAWAVALDGDGQHSPADITNFLKAIETTSASMLVGNRMNAAQSMPWMRRIINRVMSRMLGDFCDTRIPDSQCGFRMLDLHAWNRLQFSSDHFEIESEMIVRFLYAGFKVDFVPVQTRYGSESSKIRPLKDTLRWLRWWFAIRHELSSNVNRAAHPRYESTPQDATA